MAHVCMLILPIVLLLAVISPYLNHLPWKFPLLRQAFRHTILPNIPELIRDSRDSRCWREAVISGGFCVIKENDNVVWLCKDIGAAS